MKTTQADPIEDLFNALASRRRRLALALTANDGWCVTDLAAEAGVSQPTMSRHLKGLADMGLVAMEGSLAEGGGRVVGVRAQVPELERQLAEALKACHPYGLVEVTFRTGEGEETRTWK